MAGEAIIVALLLGIILGIGVGKHASARGRSGIAWGLLAFFTGLIGAIIYGLYALADSADAENEDGDGEDSDVRRVCPDCSTMHIGGPQYCSECGTELGPDDERPIASIRRSGSRGYCTNCNGKLDLDADLCQHCGAVV